jgi:twinkle protein
LWGSFEVKNNQLMKKMMQQFHGKPLVQQGEVIQGIDAIADRFQSLPLSFMTFHGGSEVDQVIDAMDYAVYAHDMQFVIVDNLQFMLSRVGRSKSGFSDRFDQQDLAVEKFRRCSHKSLSLSLALSLCCCSCISCYL